jgi:hypothetical protein
VIAAFAVLLAAATTYAGVFALPAPQRRAAATLTVARTGPFAARLDIVERAGAVTLRDYDLDMTKRMHVIVIDDRFRTFQHLHAEHDAAGHFTFALHVPAAGQYYVYADAVPHGLGQQVFRFDVPFGAEPPGNAADVRSNATAQSGPYAVTLDTLRLRSGSESTVHVSVAKNGVPARDLAPYLGAAAHAVFIQTQTLAYVHVHPIAGSGSAPMHGMAGMESTPGTPEPVLGAGPLPSTLTLHIQAPSSGTYKLWLQFRGGDGLHVAPFVLQAT